MGTGKYLEASTNRTLVQNDLNESTSNMWLAAELAQQLRAAGAKVYLTREYEYSPANAPSISLMDRARIGK